METAQRLNMCHYMQNAGMKMQLKQIGIATAIVYFHRFYARHTPDKWDAFIVATTCLFLAGKVVDTPVKLERVIRIGYKTYRGKEVERLEELRARILATEREVLLTIGFDFNSQHPYRYVASYIKCLNSSQEHLQIAWNWVNDSLKTTLCLRYKPEQIAAAAVLLAAKLLKNQTYENAIANPDVPFCNEKIDVLEEIYVQILDLYENCPGVNALKKRGVVSSTDASTITKFSFKSTSSSSSSNSATPSINDVNNTNNTNDINNTNNTNNSNDTNNTTDTIMNANSTNSVTTLPPNNPIPTPTPNANTNTIATVSSTATSGP